MYMRNKSIGDKLKYCGSGFHAFCAMQTSVHQYSSIYVTPAYQKEWFQLWKNQEHLAAVTFLDFELGTECKDSGATLYS